MTPIVERKNEKKEKINELSSPILLCSYFACTNGHIEAKSPKKTLLLKKIHIRLKKIKSRRRFLTFIV